MKNIYEEVMKQFDKEKVTQELQKQGYTGEELEVQMNERIEEFLIQHPKTPKDRLVVVTGFDLDNNKLLGTLGSKKCVVSINYEDVIEQDRQYKKAVAEGRVKEDSKYKAYAIDHNMAEVIEPKSRVVVCMSTIVEETPQLVTLEARRVLKLVNDKENTLEGILKIRNKTTDNNIKPKM